MRLFRSPMHTGGAQSKTSPLRADGPVHSTDILSEYLKGHKCLCFGLNAIVEPRARIREPLHVKRIGLLDDEHGNVTIQDLSIANGLPRRMQRGLSEDNSEITTPRIAESVARASYLTRSPIG